MASTGHGVRRRGLDPLDDDAPDLDEDGTPQERERIREAHENATGGHAAQDQQKEDDR